MKNSKAIICALARDCGQAIKKNSPRIEKLRKQFAECDVVIIENDSKDNTKQVLADWAEKSDGVHVISNDFGTLTIPPKTTTTILPEYSYHRIEKMARYRNMYLDYIDQQCKDYDYLIVLDIDVPWFQYKNITHIINEAPDDWGAISANGRTFYNLRYRYYDIYAFSETKTEKMDIHILKGDGYWQETLKNRKLISKKAYTSVYSAFGGAAIYNYSTIKGLRYHVLLNKDERIEAFCEHVSLNDAIINKGYKVYVARDFDLRIGVFNFIYEMKILLFKNRYMRNFLVKHKYAKDIKQ
ncbi:MAG: hypothetical protein LBN93_03725 [Candidatus Symbiothrix sp.]|jgi:hypothetical protein|nr:hypothetical protein [Candidatus Symbiothrix sp.]